MLETDFESRLLEKTRQAPPGIAEILRKPCSIPTERWEGLPNQAKVMTWVRKKIPTLLQDLSDEDRVLSLYRGKGMNALGAKTISILWKNSIFNDKNPTRNVLIDYVCETLVKDQPLKIYMSQCLKKASGIRTGKIDYFLRGNSEKKDVSTFVQGIEKKGWGQLRNILRESPLQIDTTIYLGDMDFETLDGCNVWCSQDSLARLSEEITALREAIQREADDYFGCSAVKIRTWSEEYDASKFQSIMQQAEAEKTWRTEAFMKKSRYPYLKNWGYRELGEQLKIPEKAMVQFIDNDIIRTAGQYRLESTLLKERGGIQAWGETVADPLWPLEISNFDKAGLPPSLILAPN